MAKPGGTRNRMTPEFFAEVCALDDEGGPALVSEHYGYAPKYAQDLVKRARGISPRTTRTGTGLSQSIGRFVDDCRHARLTGSGAVPLGALPGFPSKTTDPAVVEKAILAVQDRAARAGTSVAELRLRQRVLDLRAGLTVLQTRAGDTKDRDAFMEHGATWATNNGISYAAFREMGVPAAVLRQAGIKP